MDTFEDIRKDLDVVCSKKPEMEKLNEIFLEPSAREGYFKSTITSSTGTIFVDLNKDGQNVWSKEIYELLEIESDTFVPTPEKFLSFVVKEDRETVRQRIDDALDGNKKEDYLSYKIKTASGKVKKILAFPQIIKDGQGKVLFLNVTIHDLSNMLGKPDQANVGFDESARRLQESTNWLSKIFENSAVGIFIFNREGSFIHSNQTFSGIIGYSKLELETEIKAFDVLSEDTRKWVLEQVGLLISGKQNQINYEFPIKTKSGKQKLVEGYSTLLDAEAGYILCFVTDIDEKKETQKALKVSESRLKEAQKMAKMGSWGVELDTGRIEWSSGMYEIMEIDENRKVDKELVLSLIHPEDRDLFVKTLMVDRKDVNGLEIRHVTKSGTKHMIINAATAENRYHGTVLDISESVFFDQHLQFAQEVAKLGWWESNLITGEDVWSDSLYDILGLDKEHTTPSFEAYVSTVHPEDLGAVMASQQDPDVLKNGFHNKEVRHQMKDGSIKYVLASGQFIWDAERPVKLIGTIMDITETKTVQLRLEENQRIAKLGWYEGDLVTGIDTWSDSMYEIFDLDKETTKPSFKEYAKLVHVDDKHIVHEGMSDPEVIKNGWQNIELRHVLKNGTQKYILSSGKFICDEKGKPVKITGTLMDITESKSAQLKLEESQRIAKLGSFESDLVNGIDTWSDSLFEIFELDKEKIKPCFEEYEKLVHVDDKHIVETNMSDPERIKNGWHNLEIRHILKDGTLKYLLSSGKFILDENGKPIRLTGTLMDITMAKEAQLRLEEAQKIANIGWWKINLQTEEVSWSFVNQESGNVELQGPYPLKPYLDQIHPEDREKLMNVTDDWQNLEIRFRNESGDYDYILINGQVVYDGKKRVMLVGTNMDVTELKQAQLRLEETQKIARLGYWEVDLKSGEAKWSDAIYDIIGIDKKDKPLCFDQYLKYIHPEDLPFMSQDPRNLKDGWKNVELRYKRSCGGYTYVLSNGRVIFDGDEPVKMVGTNLDITDLKEAQHKLEQTQKIGKLGWWETDVNTGTTMFSDSIYEMMGIEKPKGGLTLEEYMQLLHPEDARKLMEDIEKGTMSDGWVNRELRYKQKDGTYRYILTSGQTIYNEEGQPVNMLGTNLDITSTKEAQLKLEEAQKIAKMGWWEADLITGVSKYSDSIYEMLEIEKPVENYTFEKYLEYMHPDDARKLQEDFNSGKLNEGWVNRELRYKRKDGGYKYILTSGQLLFDGDKPVKLIGTNLDITSTKEAQLKLEEAQKIAKMGWWEFDMTGKANHKFSDEYMEIMELSDPNEIVTTEDYLDLIHPDDHQAVLKEHQMLEKTKGWNNLVNRVRRKSGGYKYITSNAHAEFFEGKPVRLVGSLLDITDLKEIEIELEKSEINLKALITSAENIVFVIDDQLTFKEVFCNDLSKMKHSPDHFINKHIEEVWNGQLPHGKELANKCIDSMKNDAHNHMIYEFAPKEKKYWWEAHIKPFKSQDGKRRLAVFVNDITTKKNAEEELIKNIQKEKELNEMSTQFVSMASHQFRTPLTVIKSNMQLLELSNIDHPIIKKVSTRLNLEVDRLVNLMEDILAMGKVQSGVIKPHLREVDMVDLVKKLKLNIERIQEDGRVLKVNIKGAAKMVNLDSQFMEHALNNLIDNAFKYSKGAKNPEIELEYGKNKLNIRITDFGLGIPKDDQSRLFSSFQRGSNVQHISGTGLGLAVSKEFVSLNGGTLFLEKNKNSKNTTFCIDLPLN